MVSIPADVLYAFIWATMLGYVAIVVAMALLVGSMKG